MRSKKEVNVYICKRENKKRNGIRVSTPGISIKISIKINIR
jgi:hypothetical protein